MQILSIHDPLGVDVPYEVDYNYIINKNLKGFLDLREGSRGYGSGMEGLTIVIVWAIFGKSFTSTDFLRHI